MAFCISGDIEKAAYEEDLYFLNEVRANLINKLEGVFSSFKWGHLCVWPPWGSLLPHQFLFWCMLEAHPAWQLASWSRFARVYSGTEVYLATLDSNSAIFNWSLRLGTTSSLWIESFTNVLELVWHLLMKLSKLSRVLGGS